MTANPTPQPAFSGDHRTPTRAALNRWKAGVGLAVLPHRQPDVKATAKVSLQGISLSYKANGGTQLLALEDISLMMGRDLNDMSLVIAVMILIVAIGYIVDGLVFRTIERRLQQKWGLTPAT